MLRKMSLNAKYLMLIHLRDNGATTPLACLQAVFAIYMNKQTRAQQLHKDPTKIQKISVSTRKAI